MIRLTALAALLFTAGLAPAQQREVAPLPAGGFEVFRAVLDLAKFKPMTAREVNDFDQLDDVLVVIFGEANIGLNFAPRPITVADRVVRRGGAALIVHDSNLGVANPQTGILTQIDGRRVSVTRPELAYQGNLLDPLLVPEEGDDPVHGLFKGLKRVATEHPSYIQFIGFDNNTRRVLARFPFNRSRSRVWTPPSQDLAPMTPLDTFQNPFAVAAAPVIGRNGQVEYRQLIMADHAVFKNSLMAPAPTDGQTDNILLAQRTVAYLQGPDQFRKRCAYFENGQLVEDFGQVRRMMQQQDPMPNLPNPLAILLSNQGPITDMGNRLLDRVQERDVPNAILLGSPDNPGGQARRLTGILTAFLFMGSVWAALFLLRRVWRSRQPTDNPPPPYAGGSVTADRSGGVFDRRKRELVRRNNLYEPVRDLVRDLFTTAGATGGPGVKPPPIECSSVVRKPAKLREAIHDLWRLAYGKPVAVSVRRSQELAPVIERLYREHADGVWWFSGTRSVA